MSGFNLSNFSLKYCGAFLKLRQKDKAKSGGRAKKVTTLSWFWFDTFSKTKLRRFCWYPLDVVLLTDANVIQSTQNQPMQCSQNSGHADHHVHEAGSLACESQTCRNWLKLETWKQLKASKSTKSSPSNVHTRVGLSCSKWAIFRSAPRASDKLAPFIEPESSRYKTSTTRQRGRVRLSNISFL